MKRVLLFFGVLGLLISPSTAQTTLQDVTKLEGQIKGKQVDTLYLFKATSDFRSEPEARIPVNDGRFEYHTKFRHNQVYKLIYKYELNKGAWRPIEFFSEPGKIEFKLYPKAPAKNKIEGGELVKAKQEFQRKLRKKLMPVVKRINRQKDSLEKQNLYYADSARALLDKSQNAESSQQRDSLLDKFSQMKENRSHLSPTGKRHKQKVDSLRQSVQIMRNQYIRNHTNILSYYMVYESLNQRDQFELDLAGLKKAYQRHAEKYPDHPYTSLVNTELKAAKRIKIGNQFIDFKVPTLEGEQKQLSNLIDGKIALLNLWGSWCGPCIEKSNKMVPIYEKYAGEEFTVVGVAREFEDTSKLEKALDRLQYPWINLVELNDKHQIWRKYGIPYAGGGMFLIGQNGEILAVKPSPEKVREILEEKL